MKVIPIAAATAACGDESGEVPKLDLPLTRRSLLGGSGVLIGTLAAALPWVIQPVIADVMVFVLAIIFIKFRPQGLISAKGV